MFTNHISESQTVTLHFLLLEFELDQTLTGGSFLNVVVRLFQRGCGDTNLDFYLSKVNVLNPLYKAQYQTPAAGDFVCV